jgi:hypothetical protein
MARTFNGSSQYASGASAPASNVPLTISAWCKHANASGGVDIIVDIFLDGDDRQVLYINDQDIKAFTISSGGSAEATASAGASTTDWFHACGVWTAINSRAAFLNGGSKGTDTTSLTTNTLTTVRAGASQGTTGFYEGTLAEIGVWNVALDDSEVASLAKGVSPLLIRPQSLVAYWPLFGNESPELDRGKNRIDFTLTAAPTKAEHVRVYLPAEVA